MQEAVGNIETKSLTDASVTAYQSTADPFDAQDLRPLMDKAEAYVEKWEAVTYQDDGYDLKIKFEVANLGFGDFKGRVSGRLRLRAASETLETFEFDKKFSESQWSYGKDGFRVTMGDWEISGEPGAVKITGTASGETGSLSFDYELRGEAWRPGNGTAFFGRELAFFFTNNILITQAEVHATLVRDGKILNSDGGVGFVDHYATNLGAHVMADRMVYLRDHEGDVFLEWRRNDTTATYDHTPFEYFVVGYQGTVIFDSTDLTLNQGDFYTDPGNHGYSVPKKLHIEAKKGADSAQLGITVTHVNPKDPLANLPALEKAVAESVAQPTSFDLKVDWRLDLEVLGEAATVEGSGSFTITVLR